MFLDLSGYLAVLVRRLADKKLMQFVLGMAVDVVLAAFGNSPDLCQGQTSADDQAMTIARQIPKFAPASARRAVLGTLVQQSGIDESDRVTSQTSGCFFHISDSKYC